MYYDDLRAFLQALDDIGQFKRVEGADWDLEIGAISELMSEQREAKALLFDKIKGYPAGYRVVTGFLQTPEAEKLGLGLPENLPDIEVVRYWKDRSRNYKPVPPVEVESGPIKENILTGDDIDILKFPVPKWHEKDGGRYIGTGVMVITKCRDEGWVNAGTYRVMVHDKDTLSFYISPGKHGRIMRERYWARGEDCPVAMCFGQEPFLCAASGWALPWGVSEFDFTGYMKGKPVEVIKGDVTGLPIPATAEIAIEGFSPPPSVDSRSEGPFGEWTGYYASGARIEPVVKIKTIYHRRDPIITGLPPFKPGIWQGIMPIPVMTAGQLWAALEQCRIPGIKGVYTHGPSFQIIVVISIEQKYLGHAKQVASVAAGLYPPNAGAGRYIVVVDDDIDPSNLYDVIWAVCTRCDPEKSIDIVRGFVSTPLDPMISPENRAIGNTTSAKVIVNACRPYHWIDKFPEVNIGSEKLRRKTMDKWGYLFS